MSGYEVGATIAFRAIHVMPDHPPPENVPHEHEYTIEAVVRRGDLDERGMVCDLDVLTGALGELRGRLDGADLSAVVGVEVVTVEVLSRWVHAEIAEAVRADGGEHLSVRAWEGPTMFGGFAGRL